MMNISSIFCIAWQWKKSWRRTQDSDNSAQIHLDRKIEEIVNIIVWVQNTVPKAASQINLTWTPPKTVCKSDIK